VTKLTAPTPTNASAPAPHEEPRRLQSLREYEILDTPPEPQFDDLTRLAAEICGTPMATIGLIDADRQWFKSKVGPVPAQTSLEDSFSARTILNGRLSVVPDATRDRRFANSRFVTGAPHVRFYAGAPLTSHDGYALGTLAVLDSVPRSLTHAQEQALQTLARQVMAQLELRRTVARLRHDAMHDSLTGLPNRALFHQRLGESLSRAKQDPAFRYSVLFLDLDRFKVVNDSLGHAAGDQLLVSIARTLEKCARGLGSQGGAGSFGRQGAGAHTVARMGGDEFTMLLSGVGDAEASAAAADVLRAVGSTPFRIGGHEVFTGASIGIVHGDARYERAEDLVRDADAAMYRAKSGGKGCWETFETPMHEAALAWLRLDHDLRRGIERGELLLYYQPIVSLESRDLVGFEALARWKHPQRGLVSPGEFIPVAEETGQIVAIGRWALDTACRQLKAWQTKYPRHRDLTVSVNLSKRELRDPQLVDNIRNVLAQTGVRPACVKIEITESAVMETADSRGVLERIKALGVQLHMDDFGTGYSSLSGLHKFPLDGLKIDQAFIRNVSERRDYAAVVHAIITLARNLNMQVVAEGVETAEQVAMLQGLDCTQAQGYHFAKPQDAKAAEALLAEGALKLAKSA
jgi:diguanylate cyclase (GGDEF)-like protein